MKVLRWCEEHGASMILKDACGMSLSPLSPSLKEQLNGPQPCKPVEMELHPLGTVVGRDCECGHWSGCRYESQIRVGP